MLSHRLRSYGGWISAKAKSRSRRSLSVRRNSEGCPPTLPTASRPTQACISSVTNEGRARPKSPLRAQPPSSVAPARAGTSHSLSGDIFGRKSIAAARIGTPSGARGARPAAVALRADRLGRLGRTALYSGDGENNYDRRGHP